MDITEDIKTEQGAEETMPTAPEMPTEVKAIFSNVQKFKGWGNSNLLKMGAVYDPTGKYKDFTAMTPWGALEMSITEGAPAFYFFEEGEVYEVTFRKVVK